MTDFYNVLKAIECKKRCQDFDPQTGYTKKQKVSELIYVIESVVKIQNGDYTQPDEMNDNFEENTNHSQLENIILGLKK